jgi:endonuclease YncB( thermonuclease family)
MTKFLTAALVLMFASTASFAQVSEGKQKAGVTYDATVLRVIDGDTVAFAAPWLPDPLKKELSIRVFGVDTPEKSFRAKCPAEDKLGQAATAFTKDSITGAKKLQIILMDWDKYGGRVLGDVIVDGQSLRKLLITKGYAREYYGEAKTSWCN